MSYLNVCSAITSIVMIKIILYFYSIVVGLTQAICIDAAGRFVYYSDADSKVINRIHLSTKAQVTLLRLSEYDRPFKIQIDHEHGYLKLILKDKIFKRKLSSISNFRYIYWTDWGLVPRIQRANLTHGSGPEVLVSSGLERPFGMVLDIPGLTISRQKLV